MLNTCSRTRLVGGVWLATLAVIIARGASMDAIVSTTALLLVIGITPVILTALMGSGAPSPAAAEGLHRGLTASVGSVHGSAEKVLQYPSGSCRVLCRLWA